MTKTFKFAAVAMAAFVTVAHAEVKFDANIEADPTYKGSQGATKSKTYLGGRVEINANAELMKNGDNFVRAKGTLIVPLSSTGNNEVTIDDAWIQFGNASVDLKLGRQEAADLFPMGKDVVVEGAGPTGGYRANSLRGRFKDGKIHFVVGLNAAPGLRAELGVVSHKDGGSGIEQGLRPTVVYSSGALTLRAGYESYKTNGVAGTTTGYGLSVGYALSQDANLNASFAKSSDLNKSPFGLNATFGPAGVGYVQDKDSGANTKVNTLYAAYSFPLMGIKGATITPAISHSKGTGVDSLTAVRVRLNYAF